MSSLKYLSISDTGESVYLFCFILWKSSSPFFLKNEGLFDRIGNVDLKENEKEKAAVAEDVVLFFLSLCQPSSHCPSWTFFFFLSSSGHAHPPLPLPLARP